MIQPRETNHMIQPCETNHTDSSVHLLRSSAEHATRMREHKMASMSTKYCEVTQGTPVKFPIHIFCLSFPLSYLCPLFPSPTLILRLKYFACFLPSPPAPSGGGKS
jgi:hypothetical protein